MKKLMDIFTRFAHDNDIPFQRPSSNQIVLDVESKHQSLSTVFQIQDDDDGYEHYTHILDVPQDKRGVIAEKAISEAYREISPTLPADDNRLMLYGSRTRLRNKSEDEIKYGILNDMGRVAGYDDENYPFFRDILSR